MQYSFICLHFVLRLATFSHSYLRASYNFLFFCCCLRFTSHFCSLTVVALRLAEIPVIRFHFTFILPKAFIIALLVLLYYLSCSNNGVICMQIRFASWFHGESVLRNYIGFVKSCSFKTNRFSWYSDNLYRAKLQNIILEKRRSHSRCVLIW